jgi:hypothetical protein
VRCESRTEKFHHLKDASVPARMTYRTEIIFRLAMLFLLLSQSANCTKTLQKGRLLRRTSLNAVMSSSPNEGELAQSMGRNLGISRTTRHIFLCADQTKPKCCSTVKGLESWDFLKARLKELKLVGPNALVGRTKANCLQVFKFYCGTSFGSSTRFDLHFMKDDFKTNNILR